MKFVVVHLVKMTTRPNVREKPKWQIRKGKSTDVNQGADQLVVAMKLRNGSRAKGLGCP
jgi:hypothetical protein